MEIEARISRVVAEYIQHEARCLRIPPGKVEPVPRLTLRVLATRCGVALRYSACTITRFVCVCVAASRWPASRTNGLCRPSLPCSDKEYFVGPQMKARYAAQGYPEYFPQRSKTMLLFQVRATARVLALVFCCCGDIVLWDGAVRCGAVGVTVYVAAVRCIAVL
jgi:hypothetical protein